MGNSFLMFLLSFKKVLSPKNAKAKIKSLKINSFQQKIRNHFEKIDNSENGKSHFRFW